jgi:hypothetical protein
MSLAAFLTVLVDPAPNMRRSSVISSCTAHFPYSMSRSKILAAHEAGVEPRFETYDRADALA